MRKKMLGALILVTALSTTACGKNDKQNSNKNDVNSNVTSDVESNEQQEETSETQETTETEETDSRTAIDLKNNNVIEDVAEYQIKEIATTSKLEPSDTSGFYRYYEADAGKQILYVSMDVKNLLDKDLSVSKDMNVSFTMNGTDYSTSELADDDSGFSTYPVVKQLKTGRLIFFTQIPEDADTSAIEMVVTIADKESAVKFSLEEVKPEKNIIKIGDVISKDDHSEVTIKGTKITTRLEPNDTSGRYSFYEVKDTDSVYVVLEVDVKNTKSNSLKAESVLNMKAVYNDKYTYDSFSTIEVNGDLKYTSITSIDPLKTNTIFYLAEAPKEVQDGKIELQISYNGEKYYLEVQ